MAKNIDRITDLMGAVRVAQVPDTGGGAFGAARLSRLLHARLQPGSGRRLGRPTDSAWVRHPKVPMSEETMQRLSEIASKMSTTERKISPMQVAAQLLEVAVRRVG